jgi:hypothetical protein
LEEADALGRAEAIFRPLHHPAGLFLLELARIELLERKGEHREALAGLDALAGYPLVRRRTELQGEILALRMSVLTNLGAEAELLKLRREYERLRRRQPSQLRDMDVYRTLGRWFAAKESRTEAAEAYGCALKAIRQVYDSFHDGDDQERFLAVHRAGLLAEIKQALRQAGKETEAEAVDSLFVPRAEVERRAAEAKRKQDLRYRWVAVLVTAINLVIALVGVGAAAMLSGESTSGTEPPKPAIFVASMFLVWAVFNTLFLVVDVGLGLLIPSRWRGGVATIVLGVFPWMVVLVVAVLVAGVLLLDQLRY